VKFTAGLAWPASSLATQDTVVAVDPMKNTPRCAVASLARKVRGLPLNAPVQVMVGSGVTLSVAVMAGKVTVASDAAPSAIALMGTEPVIWSLGLAASVKARAGGVECARQVSKGTKAVAGVVAFNLVEAVGDGRMQGRAAV
jgi:hypothetical protein